jgi:Trk K+ transport system NAD-binding subunit
VKSIASFLCSLLDLESDRITQAEEMGYLAQIGNATDENLLIEVGINKARILATIRGYSHCDGTSW